MTRNDVIAEYVKEKYPEIIKTTDFTVYSFRLACKSIMDNFEKAFKKIDFSQLLKAVDNLEEKQ